MIRVYYLMESPGLDIYPPFWIFLIEFLSMRSTSMGYISKDNIYHSASKSKLQIT